MDIVSILKARRTIHQFRPDPVDPGVLREMVDAAVFVPNHHRTEPWEFYVLQADSLRQAADYRYHAVLQKNQGQPAAERKADKARNEMVEVPAVIVVTARVDPNPFRAEEDYAAAVMAAYNMTLVAHARGLGSYWHTGPLTYFDPFRQWLGLSPDQRIVCYLRIGHPAAVPRGERTPGLERTRWMD